MGSFLKMKPLSLVISGAILVSALGGCANTKIANTGALDQKAREMASNAEISPEQAIISASNKISKANEDELGFYAPLHMSAAKEALEDAQKAMKKSQPPSLILEKAFLAETQLNAAYANKAVVIKTLALSLEQRSVLESLDVPSVMPKAYRKSLNKIEDLVKEIEGGNHDKALEGEPDVLEYMVGVEIDTLKKVHLAPAESMLDRAESVDADEYAENTFAQAEQVLESSELFIEKSYRDRDGVKKSGLEALNAAAHAYYVAKEAQLIVGLNPETAEQRILLEESLLARINQIVGIEQLNTMSLYDQSVALATAIEKLKMAHSVAQPNSLDAAKTVGEQVDAITAQAEEIDKVVQSEMELAEELNRESLDEEVVEASAKPKSAPEARSEAASTTKDAATESTTGSADEQQ